MSIRSKFNDFKSWLINEFKSWLKRQTSKSGDVIVKRSMEILLIVFFILFFSTLFASLPFPAPEINIVSLMMEQRTFQEETYQLILISQLLQAPGGCLGLYGIGYFFRNFGAEC